MTDFQDDGTATPGPAEPAVSETARRIAAGEPVDWPLIESGIGDDSRPTLDGLRDLERIATFHRVWRDDVAATYEPTPETWGSLRIVEQIGRGAFGRVYRAHDPGLDRDVALKLLAPEFAAAPAAARAFIAEGRHLAKLRHRNIVSVHRADQIDGRLGLEMELIAGRTLADIVATDGPFAPDEAALIGRDISRALAAVHKAGLVHRDVKAQNVMRETGGRVVLMDFGAGQAETSSSAAHAAGTPLYLAPEVLAGGPSTRQSDLYSLGVLLYFLVTGAFPTSARTIDELRAAHHAGARTSLRDARPDLPDAFIHLVERALDPDPARRPESAGVFEAELSQSLGQMDGRARKVRRKRMWPLVAGVALVGAIAASAWAFWPRASRPAGVVPAPSRSIAVLPFANRSGGADGEDLADGVTDELIGVLGKVPSLRVVGRTSAFAFKGQAVQARDIGQRLGVEMFLEGTVRRDGSHVRITVSLVGAADGFQRWSETFESATGDVFALQDDITRAVVARLAVDLDGAALLASRAGRTTSVEAHDLYLRGLAAANRASEPELRRAIRFYEEAIDKDPNFARAYAGIAQVHVQLADAYEPANKAYAAAKAAALAAISKDDLVADAHALLGYAGFAVDWNAKAAEREYRRALEIDPNSLAAQTYYGTHLCGFGQPNEARQVLRRASELDPLSPFSSWVMEWCEYMLQDHQRLIEAHARTEAIAPGFWYLDSLVGAAYRELGNYPAALREYEVAARAQDGAPQWGLAFLYLRMGRRAEARTIARQLDDLATRQYVPLLYRAALHGALGDMDTGVALLQRSVDEHELLLVGLPKQELKELLTDPRARRIFDQAQAIWQHDR